MNQHTIAEFLEDQEKTEQVILQAIRDFHGKYMGFIKFESQPITLRWNHSENPNVIKKVKLAYSVIQR